MSDDKLRSIIKEHLTSLTTESKADGYKDPAYRATVKQFKGKKASKEEFAQALAMHHKSMDESVNEISAQAGLKDVLKGRTTSIEGVKLSKDVAEGILDWIQRSPYGKKYSKHILKGRIASLIGPANSMGIERYLSSKGKQEWKALYAKHGPKREAVIEQLKELQSIGEHHDDPDFPGKDLSAWDLLDKLKSGNIDLYNKVEDFMKTMNEVKNCGCGKTPCETYGNVNEMEGVPHYTKDGNEWTGPTHKMPNGKLMTGDPHNDESEELFHKEDLTEAKTQFAVEYRDAKGKPKKKDEPIIKRFNSKSQAEAFAKKGNKVDSVGGTYKVVEVPVVESVVTEAEDYKYKKQVGKAFDKINDAMFNFRHAFGVKQLTNTDMKLKKKVESLHSAIFDLQKEMRKGGLSEGILTEMDLNDPILIAVRARKTMLAKAKAAPKVKKISMAQYYKLMDTEVDLIGDLKNAYKEYEQLDSDMNQEAGQKGKEWTDADANRYGGKLDKIQTKIEKLGKLKLAVKKSIMNYRTN